MKLVARKLCNAAVVLSQYILHKVKIRLPTLYMFLRGAYTLLCTLSLGYGSATARFHENKHGGAGTGTATARELL